MKILKIFFAILIFNAVYSQNKSDNPNIVVTEPKSTNTKIPKSWKSLKSIQKEWIKLEEDEKGYLIYDPCNGDTPTIKLDQVIIINSVSESGKFNFEKFTRITGNEAFRLDAYNPETKTWFEIKAKIIDHKKGIVLWEFSGVRWLMTPIENREKFRNIKNNCTSKKRKELKFLPIKENIGV